MLIPVPTIRKVPDLSDEQSKAIRDFFQGAIYCWCKNRPREWFSLRDLMGGENVLWDNTPLEVLWRRYEHDGKHGFRSASIQAGWLLQRVLEDDRRTFETTRKNTLCYYRWTGDENLVRGKTERSKGQIGDQVTSTRDQVAGCRTE